MLRRRLAALLSTALMLQLTVRSGSLDCTAHGTQMPRAVHRMPSMPPMPGMPESVHESASADDRPPCDAPTRPDCCQTMTACGFSVAIGSEASTTRGRQASDRVAASVSGAPSSRMVAPEPPPPKP